MEERERERDEITPGGSEIKRLPAVYFNESG